MARNQRSLRLETEAIVIGYAMSRLDVRYFDYRNASTWQEVFQEASRALAIPASSLKNLRDEFDPVHGNQRRGWHQRSLRSSRQRVLEDLKEVSDDALMALVEKILVRDEAAVVEAIDSLTPVPRTAQQVAERLLTGQRAEQFFLAHCQEIVGFTRDELIDHRLSACGYDFGVSCQPECAIEVKGLKPLAGEILFTDREWIEAQARRENYLLIVVANLELTPRPKVIADPGHVLQATCSQQVSVATVWRTKVSVGGHPFPVSPT